MVSVVKNADTPACVEGIDEIHQGSRTFWKFEAIEEFTAIPRTRGARRGWQASAHHVSEMHFCKFIVTEIEALKSVGPQLFQQGGSIRLVRHLNANEDVGPFALGHPVAELRQASLGQLIAERAQAAR